PDPARRSRRHAVRGREAADHDRSRLVARCADPDPRRADLGARRPDRGAGHAAIETLMQGRTTFIIAHRLSTVRRCDTILVLRDGIIAEQGGFAELLRRGGIFAEYYQTQFAPEAEAKPELRVLA